MIKFFIKYTSLTIFMSVFFNKMNAQIIFEQDICNCGVTGDGYSPGASSDSGQFNLNINNSSTIKKAYLFMGVHMDIPRGQYDLLNKTINFDGNILSLESLSYLTNDFISIQTTPVTIFQRRAMFEVTSFINSSQNIYSISPPINQFGPFYGTVVTEFYLLVIYENPLLNKTGYSIIINNQDIAPVMNYVIDSINPVNLNNNVALSINSSGICDTSALQDGSYVSIDNTPIGLIGGQEPLSVYCAGPQGAFYYQDSTLYGLGNDIANTTMAGVDLIANIESYIINPNNFNIEFEYQDIGSPDERTNAILELFLTYTTPCDTFSVTTPNDTTVCYGTQLQLNATGGQTYEWLPSVGLSCNTCPNPIFTADSTMHYTVRIWNNDSCSVVKPLQIIVSQPRIENVSFISPDCGTNNGQLTISGSSFSWLSVNYNIDGGTLQIDSVFTNLAEGTYLLGLEDAAGCTADTSILLQSVNTTVASFSTNMGATQVPVTVFAENFSQNATVYEWYVNGAFFSNTQDILPVFNTTGVHTIELIAWQYDPSCADTAYQVIEIQNQAIVPTAFTPDGDGINDFWEILYLDERYPKNQVFVYNRWGSLVYSSDVGDYAGRPWWGKYKGEDVAVASYFYVIETGVSTSLNNPDSLNNPNASGTQGSQTEAKLKGSVTVVRR